MSKYGTIYNTVSNYVDTTTGELIDKSLIQKKKYIIIKKTKNAKYNTTGTRCTIEYTFECRPNPQGEIYYG